MNRRRKESHHGLCVLEHHLAAHLAHQVVRHVGRLQNVVLLVVPATNIPSIRHFL